MPNHRFRVLPVMMTLLSFLALVVPASAQWNLTAIHNFQGGAEGERPLGRVVRDLEGNLYGATEAGGALTCWAQNCGTVYEFSPPAQVGGAWSETILHVFHGNTTGDGSWPFGGLVTDGAGDLYGTTAYGGTGNCNVLGTFPGCGTVYELSPPAKIGGAWTETILHSFQGGEDGYLPNGDLLRDKFGNLYGATSFGGGFGTNCGDDAYPYCGTIYELSPPIVQGGAWTEAVLYSFKGVAPPSLMGDGANPNGGLVQDSLGAIYGTTQIGGLTGVHRTGWGTVFKLTPAARRGQQWAETILHTFLSGPDGGTPAGGLFIDRNGNLVGVTEEGGAIDTGYGTVFEFIPQSDGMWSHYELYSFSGRADGGDPETSVISDAIGNLYGTGATGGSGLRGTVYRLEPTAVTARSIDVLYSFSGPQNADGAMPLSSLTFDEFGNIYGTTAEGGTGMACSFYGCGTVFELEP